MPSLSRPHGVLGLRLSDTTPIFLESGLYYTEKGGKGTDTGVDPEKINATTRLNYLKIPLLVKHGFKATEDTALLPFFGPYFSTAIGGKTNKHSAFNKEYFKHFDTGFKLGCGMEYSMLYLEMGYQFGLSNISKNEDCSAHNGAFFANFGVNF
ncbi:MAG: outer membrane beta-barrel protein [Prevotella sp.]|nr:outer membrane beta-barrel protein [Prevotella sp.]